MTLIGFGLLDALIFFAAYLYFNQGLTIGDFTSFQFYMFSFLMNLIQIGTVFGEVLGVLGTTAGIASIFLYDPTIPIDGGNKVTPDSLDDGNIKIENIKFTYPTKKEITVVKDVSIVVEKNKTVALVGSSGCGKSTLI